MTGRAGHSHSQLKKGPLAQTIGPRSSWAFRQTGPLSAFQSPQRFFHSGSTVEEQNFISTTTLSSQTANADSTPHRAAFPANQLILAHLSQVCES